jgi:hypothetical protein
MSEGLQIFARTPQFPTTSWSLIANARYPQSEVSREALGRLCGGYWFPIYAPPQDHKLLIEAEALFSGARAK